MKRALPVALFAALLAAAACALGRAGGRPSRHLAVEPHPVTVTLVEFGEVEAREVSSVLAPITGEVTWVADEGSALKRGQPVLKMGTDELESRLAEDRRAGVGLEGRLETRRMVTEAIRRHRRDAARRARIELEIARLRLAEAEGRPTPEEKKLADLDLAAAELRARRAAADEESLRDLAGRGYISEARAKQARLALVRAQAELARARAAGREVLAGSAPETLRALKVGVKKAEMAQAQARFNAETDVAVALEGVAVARTRFEVHRERLERIQRDIDGAAAKSPIDGIVALVDVWKGGSDLSPVQVGETHRRGREILKMADVSALRVRVHINERDIIHVRLGQEARVRLVSQPGRAYRARVAELAIYADDKNRRLGSLAMEKSGAAGVNVVDVFLELEVPEDAPRPRLGSSAEVEIVVRRFEKALTVPLPALVWRAGEPRLRVLRAGAEQEVPVRIEASTEDEAVIAEGLVAGDEVVLPGGTP